MENWIAPAHTKLPDFIICGAMKSGTTTLHAMLNHHPNIAIPQKEIHFFDLDNIIQHPDFNFYQQGKWHNYLRENNYESPWHWYSKQFDLLGNNKTLGEDSTTYLASPLAAKRIALQNKKIKIIIMLRQPSDRAFSQYWHLVRSGRAIYNFETTLQLAPHSIINRSLYLQQIKSFLEYIPRQQIKFVIFEDFIRNKSKILSEICQFLNVSYEMLPTEALTYHENAGSYPKFYSLQLLKNKILPFSGNLTYLNHFEGIEKIEKSFYFNALKYINALHRKINPLVTKKPYVLSQETKQLLDDYFKKELIGLNELIGLDAMSLWFDN